MDSKKQNTNPLSFEDNIHIINNEIQKRKSKWRLNAISWIDYNDVSSIIRIHIWKKWDMYDPDKGPLAPWLNKIISHQINNLIRNIHGNYAKPCLKCAAAEGDDLCAIYQKQCSECPLFKTWENTKKNAHDIKFPTSIDNVVFNGEDMSSSYCIIKAMENLHVAMKKVLKPIEWKVYKMIYMEDKTEVETAKKMGYTTTEKNRSPGYRQIKNIQKAILLKAKKIIYGDEHEIL